MQLFNDKMDEVLINNKMTTEIMQGNDVVDNNVDHMMDALKQEIALEDNNKIIEGAQKQQQYNYNTQKQNNNANHDPFLDQLKGLWTISQTHSLWNVLEYCLARLHIFIT